MVHHGSYSLAGKPGPEKRGLSASQPHSAPVRHYGNAGGQTDISLTCFEWD